MIKSLIVLSIFSGFFAIVIGFGDIFIILLQIKGTFIWLFGMFFSRLAIFSMMAVIAYEIIHKFTKKL